MAIWAFSLPNCQILHQQILKNNCDVLKYLTLPTTKAGGFLFLPLLHWRIPYGTAMSTQCPQAMFILFPYALRYSFYLYADCICSPFFKILIPALIPLLCSAWQFGHSHTRTARFFTSGFWYPQQEQVWLLGYIVGTFTILFPYQTDLYKSIVKN